MEWFVWKRYAKYIMIYIEMMPVVLFGGGSVSLTSLSVATQKQATECVPLLLLLDSSSPELDAIAARLSEIGAYTGQWKVMVERQSVPRNRGDIEVRAHTGYPLVLYMHMDEDGAYVSGRLYDASAVEMLMGKRWARRDSIRAWAASIAHDLWCATMGTPSSFVSSIAYVRRTKKGKRFISEICVADWDGEQQQTIVQRGTIVVGPAWSKTKGGQDRLLFSEFTAHNVRVMTTDLTGRVSVALNLPGTTVGVVSEQSGAVVYCRSGELWEYIHDELLHQGKHILLLQEFPGPCACPAILGPDTIVYCAQGSIKLWNRKTRVSSLIDGASFCCSPTANGAQGIIVYSRRVKKIMQLFLYDMDSRLTRQITFGPGDKVDPTLSPCGTMVAYTYVYNQAHEIHLCTLANGMTRPISPSGVYCISPAWSGSACQE